MKKQVRRRNIGRKINFTVGMVRRSIIPTLADTSERWAGVQGKDMMVSEEVVVVKSTEGAEGAEVQEIPGLTTQGQVGKNVDLYLQEVELKATEEIVAGVLVTGEKKEGRAGKMKESVSTREGGLVPGGTITGIAIILPGEIIPGTEGIRGKMNRNKREGNRGKAV